MSNGCITALGISFVFICNITGASLVFLLKKVVSPLVNTVILGLASGIMVAASVWSLIIPAIAQSGSYGIWSFVPAAVGIALGAALAVVLELLIPRFGNKDTLTKGSKLFLAVTLHNIPEGLAVGFAFGAAAAVGSQAAHLTALGLAIGIGIQNFPEGAAVALPLKQTIGRAKAFGYGALSGAVEPLFAVVGYLLAAYIAPLQPWLLALAAGAMIFVSVQDLIPDAITSSARLGAIGFLVGFIIMMTLDVALG